MRNRFVMLMAAVMIASPALAEPPTGSRLGSRTISGLQRTEEESAAAAQKLASCMVAKRGSAAREYVLADTPEAADKAQSVLFKQIECMSWVQTSDMSDTSHVSIPRDVLRGQLAEALLKGEAGAVAALAVLPLAKDYSRPWFAATSRNAVIDEMAACVADTNPQGIAGILKTREYSQDERAAFGAVAPSLGPCLRVGAKLQANRQALRAALADALYQRITRPAPAAQFAAAKAATQQARFAFKKFAECVVSKNAQDAQAYVVEDMPEAQFARLRNKMLDEACWRTSTGLQPPIMTTGLKLQGMIAEVLMAHETDQGPLQQISAISPLKHETITDENRKNDPETVKLIEAMLELFSAGECVVRADVNGSHALLKSGVASAQESETLAALKPTFGTCIKVDPGYTVTPDELRAAVAVNYYRLVHAPKPATASAGGTK
jgi:hypothetical protein